jgi:hypothetical protein
MASIVVSGDTSGTVTLQAPAVSGTTVLTLPTTSGTIVTTAGASALTTSGNLTFTGTGNRITGDFSNATNANRVAFQSSTTNGNTSVGAIPNGTAVASGFRVYGSSDTNNTSFGQLLQNGSSETQLRSDISGTGTYAALTMYTGGSERLRITTTGAVGIGTTAPGQLLDVSSSGESIIAVTSTGAGGKQYNFISSPTAGLGTGIFSIYDRTGNASRLIINNSGLVGIGVNINPEKQLSVYDDNASTTTTTGIVVTNFNTTANSRSGIAFKNFDNYGAAIWSPRTGGTAGNLIFGTNGSGSIAETNIAERMRIASTGNVGIGTTGPLAQLSIGFAGSATSTPRALLAYSGDTLGSTTNDMVYVSEFAGNTGNQLRLLFALRRTAAGASWETSAWRIQPGVDSSFTGPSGNRGYLEFGFGNAGAYTGVGLSGNGGANPDVVVNTSGFLGIGTTAPAVSLEVAGTIRSSSATIASAATITPTAGTTNQYTVTALATAATIAAPSGTPTDGQKLLIRLKDNGVARALTWTTTSGAYRAVGVTLPTTTTAGKVTYVGCVYNSQDTFWDVIAVTTQA